MSAAHTRNIPYKLGISAAYFQEILDDAPLPLAANSRSARKREKLLCFLFRKRKNAGLFNLNVRDFGKRALGYQALCRLAKGAKRMSL